MRVGLSDEGLDYWMNLVRFTIFLDFAFERIRLGHGHLHQHSTILIIA